MPTKGDIHEEEARNDPRDDPPDGGRGSALRDPQPGGIPSPEDRDRRQLPLHPGGLLPVRDHRRLPLLRPERVLATAWSVNPRERRTVKGFCRPCGAWEAPRPLPPGVDTHPLIHI